MAQHESLGKIFRTFQLRAGLRGTDNGNAAQGLIALEIIVDAFHERVLRPYDHHIDIMVEGKAGHAVEVRRFEFRHVRASLRRAGIAGRDKEFFYFVALGDFPCQRMFAAAAAEQKDVHGEYFLFL